MAINIYNIKKWHKMLTGKSVLHVNQDLGKYFEANLLYGFRLVKIIGVNNFYI